MLLLPSRELPEGPNWAYEPKLDGYRALAIRTDGRVHLRSRNNKDFNARYAAVAKVLAALPDETRQFILGVITQPSIRGSRLRTEPAQLRPLSATAVLAPSGLYAGPRNPESFATPPQRIGILGSRSPAV